jgi:hypothetical protein
MRYGPVRLHTKDLPANIISCALRGLSDGRLRLSDSPQQQVTARPPAAPRVRTIVTRPRHACSIARSLWGREDYCDARAAGVFNSPQPTNSCGPWGPLRFHQRCAGARCAVQRARACEVALPLSVTSGRALWPIDQGGAAHLVPRKGIGKLSAELSVIARGATNSDCVGAVILGR